MDEAVLKKLKRKGFEPTPTNLHLTLQSGMADALDALELCLHSGVSPETRDPKPPHVTPLMVAVSRRRQPKVIARLLAAGANPALTDDQGWSAVAHLVAHFDAEVSKKQDTFAEVFAMLTAHPEVSAEDRALWSPGQTPWSAYLRLGLRALARKRPALAAHVGAPATEAQLAQAEAAFERPFPDVLRDVYRVFNGWAPSHYLDGWQVLPLKELVSAAHSLKGRALGNDLGSRGYRELKWSPKFIPFATDNTGDLLFTSPRMLGDRAIARPADPTYIYRHAEDQVVRHFFQLRSEFLHFFSQAGVPR
jgi:hypothetical protein